MRIIVAVDDQPYSARALAQAARLARNTWPDVRLLAVAPAKSARPAGADDHSPHPWWPVLQGYRRDFLAAFPQDQCPYPGEDSYRLQELERGWEELDPQRRSPKDLRIRLRLGTPAKEILAECQELGSDLVIIGCQGEQDCSWAGDSGLPQKVAGEAPCSVLVVKGQTEIEQMVCCLDHDQVSQASLELINQLVTLYQPRLEIVGLTSGDSLKAEVEKKMAGIMEYYNARDIRPWLELVEQDALPAFVSRQAQRGIVALWMGKTSIFSKIFSRGKVRQLVQASRSPVLILR